MKLKTIFALMLMFIMMIALPSQGKTKILPKESKALCIDMPQTDLSIVANGLQESGQYLQIACNFSYNSTVIITPFLVNSYAVTTLQQRHNFNKILNNNYSGLMDDTLILLSDFKTINNSAKNNSIIRIDIVLLC